MHVPYLLLPSSVLAAEAGALGSAAAARLHECPTLTGALWAGLWVLREEGVGSGSAAVNQELRGTQGVRRQQAL